MEAEREFQSRNHNDKQFDERVCSICFLFDREGGVECLEIVCLIYIL